MPKISVLPKQLAELIAAGEVVERPASVIKELTENSIDAGATAITVEIKGGGILYMRVTDNGCGIKKEEVKTAFLRHATSKIVSENDLDSISTLGFRGEALAAICAVSKVELLTRREDDELGTCYKIEGGAETFFDEAGCDVGTTFIVRDLFYNTPARMKFLHKDVYEGNVIADIVQKIALSHPEIAVKFIRDGRTVFATNGDGKLSSAIYTVLGREIASGFIPVDGGVENIKVTGYVCKPIYCRPKRNAQYFFLNGRSVKSVTAAQALEVAYKNSAMVGKFPSCVLHIEMPFDSVDVNVHPTKTQVRFSNEKPVFEAVYVAVKNAILKGDTRPQFKEQKQLKFSAFQRMTAEDYRQSVITEPVVNTPKKPEISAQKPVFKNVLNDLSYIREEKSIEPVKVTEVKEEPKETVKEKPITNDIRYVGEAFKTYIIAEMGDSIFFIDKHAAHERIIFEKLKKSEVPQSQALLLPVTVKLDAEQYNTVLENNELLTKSGFEIEDFGNLNVIVRAIPATLTGEDTAGVLVEAAEGLKNGVGVTSERLDNIYHTVACKAAIKAGYITSEKEQLYLAEQVLLNNDIMYCPHGRPVAYEIKRRDFEKQFGRIQ